MPAVDVVDESFVYAEPAVVAARLADASLLRRWWPDLELTVFQDRGVNGVRWTVTGSLVGTSEVWLEPMADGVVVHYFLRADPTRRGSPVEPLEAGSWWGRRTLRRASRRAVRRHTRDFKRAIWALKDELEAGRPVGVPRVAPPDRRGEVLGPPTVAPPPPPAPPAPPA